MGREHKLIVVILLFSSLELYPLYPMAESDKYNCSIKHVLRLNDKGSFVRHGWAANYMNRKFFVDRDTGKVIGTTALKVRLSNYDATHNPRILEYSDVNKSYKVITLFNETGEYALIQIDENVESSEKPFFYHTIIGMILSGTCSLSMP